MIIQFWLSLITVFIGIYYISVISQLLFSKPARRKTIKLAKALIPFYYWHH